VKRKEDFVRTFFAVIFVAGSIANFVISQKNPSLYQGFADLSILPVYREIWLGLVYPRLPVMMGAVILFEATLAFLLLGQGKTVKIGAFLGAAFMMFLIPFWWAGGALLNLIFGILLFWIGSLNYPATILQLLSRRSQAREEISSQ
jgi:hypothetical protein